MGDTKDMGRERGPLISVVMATWNSARTLARAMDSVLDQTFSDRELIVMDGGSTDGTLEIVAARRDRLAHWSSEPDQGLYHAWNKALEVARGRWICFIGADDFLQGPDVLARVAPHLQEADRDGVRLIYGDVALMDSGGGTVIEQGNPEPDEVVQGLRRGHFIRHVGAFHHRGLFARRGFDLSYRICADWELLLPEFMAGRARKLPGILVCSTTLGGLSTRLETLPRVKLELLRGMRRHGGVRFPARFVFKALLMTAFVLLLRPLGMRRAALVADWTRRLRGLPSRFSV